MALTKTGAWSLGTVGLCVALSAGSWFGLIEPQRAEAADLREQTVAAEQSNAQLEVRIEQLRKEYADLPARQAELAAIRQALPDEPALAALLRELNGAAKDSGVTLDSVVTGGAAAVVDPAAVTAVAEAPAEGEAVPEPSAEPSPEPSAEPAPDAAAGVETVAGAPVGAVLASVPVTIDLTGGFSSTNLFLKAVQTDISRALLVEGFGITALEATQSTSGDDSVDSGQKKIEPGTVTTTITAKVFVFVDPDGVTGTEAPAAATD